MPVRIFNSILLASTRALIACVTIFTINIFMIYSQRKVIYARAFAIPIFNLLNFQS